MAIALRAAGAVTGATDAVTALNPAVPAGTTTGDLSLLFVAIKPFGATMTAPSGWTLVDDSTSGSTAQGADSGSMHLYIFKRESAPVGAVGTLALTGANSAAAGIVSYSKSAGGTWDTSVFDDVADTTATGWSATSPSAFPLDVGDWLIGTAAINTDAGTNSNPGFSASGITFGAAAGRLSAAVTTGNDMGLYVADAPITAGTATVQPTFTFTNASLTSSARGETLILRLREVGGTTGPAAPALVRCAQDIPGTTSQVFKVGTTDATSVRMKVGTDSAVTAGVIYSAAATPDAQGNAQLTVTGLTAGTRYYYRLAMTDAAAAETLDTWTNPGEFKTDAASMNFTVAFGSCTDAADSASFAAIAAKKPDLFLHLGDEYYNDDSGDDVANLRVQIGGKRTATNYKAVLRVSGFHLVPSDHDASRNNSNAGTHPTAWANWNTVYREMNPTAGLPANGVYQSFKRGRVRFLAIDRRSFATIPSATDNSSKTSLGATQKQWLKDEITNSTEPLIIIQNPDAWHGSAVTGDDDWLGYITERTELANHISASGKNVIFLGGDMHALAAEDGSSSPGGVAVFHAAPFNNSSSHKGGPYDVGPYPSTLGTVVEQYGWLDVTDSGSQIQVVFTGYSADNTARVTMTKTYSTTAAVPATVEAPTATATAAALAPTVVGGQAATVQAPAAAATATALAPSVSVPAAVAAPRAQAAAMAIPPAVSAGAVIVAPRSQATAAARTANGTAGATVSVPTATATATARTPVITAGSTATVQAPRATAAAAALAPTVTAAATVIVGAATATAQALPAQGAAGAAATVFAPAARATAEVLIPTPTAAAVQVAPAATAVASGRTVTATQGVNVQAPPATATATVRPVTVQGSAVVSVPAATATAAALAPLVAAAVAATVQAPRATATAAALVATPAAGATLTLPRSTATAAGRNMTVSAGATITITRATATAAMRAMRIYGQDIADVDLAAGWPLDPHRFDIEPLSARWIVKELADRWQAKPEGAP